jgi:hypothetical protein
MTELSAARNLQPLEKSAPSRQAKKGNATGIVRRLLAKDPQRDLIVVVAFCLLGLLLTFAFLFAVPDTIPAAGDISFIP